MVAKLKTKKFQLKKQLKSLESESFLSTVIELDIEEKKKVIPKIFLTMLQVMNRYI